MTRRGRRPFAHKGFLAAPLVLACIFCFPARDTTAASGSDVTPAIRIEMNDGGVSATLRDAPLEDVLRRLSERAGFGLNLREDLRASVSGSFTDLSPEEAVEWLLRDRSWAAAYSSRGRLAELYVYRQRRNGAGPGAGHFKVNAAEPSGSNDVVETHSVRTGISRRLQEIETLARKKPDGAVGKLAEALASDEDRSVRWNAAAALAGFAGEAAGFAGEDGENAADALTAALVDTGEDPDVRRLAAWALGKLGNRNTEWALRVGASDANATVSKAAKEALKQLNTPAQRPEQRSDIRVSRTIAGQ